MSRLRRILRRFAREERGQIMALYVLALPAALAITALALDGGKLMVTRLHLQNAADAASLAAIRDVGPYLAGVQDEVSTRFTIEDDVNCYAHMNHAPVGNCGLPPYAVPQLAQCVGAWADETNAQRALDNNCYMWPYRKHETDTPDYTRLEVRLRKQVSLDFGGLPGIPKTSHPWARAVATFQSTVTAGSTDFSTTTDVFSNPDQIIPGSTTVETTVIDGSTIYNTTTTPDQTLPTTTVIPGETHTTTVLTGTPSGGGVAWAMSTDCPAISWTGSQTGALGDFGTNGGFFSNGATPKSMDYLALGKRGTPGCNQNQAPVTINKIVGPFDPQGWPIPMPSIPTPISSGTPGPGECYDLGSASITFKAAGHPSGVYCLTGGATLTVNSDLTAGGKRYTFFAGSIVVSGAQVTNFPPVSGQPPTLFYAENGDVTVQGGSSILNGDIFVPNGDFSIRGGNAVGGSGFIECQHLNIAGTFASYTGTGPFGGETTTVVVTTDPDTTVTGSTTIPGTTTVETTVINGTTQLVTTTTPDQTIPGSTYTVTTVLTTTTPGTTATTGTQGLGE